MKTWRYTSPPLLRMRVSTAQRCGNLSKGCGISPGAQVPILHTQGNYILLEIQVITPDKGCGPAVITHKYARGLGVVTLWAQGHSPEVGGWEWR